MTLLESKPNQDIGNSDFATKSNAYRNSTFQTTQALAEKYDTWNEDKIEARQKQLVKITVGIRKM